MLLLAAALLSRVVPDVRGRRLHRAVGVYLALTASYGIALIANDAWGEQVKRDWTRWKIPGVIRPDVTPRGRQRVALAPAVAVAGGAARAGVTSP